MTALVDDPVALTAQLATIDSVNPSLVKGAAGEREIAGFVAEWCRGRGLEVHVDEVAPGRPNVVAVRRGHGGGRSLLFNGHLDTVGAASALTMDVRVDGDRLVGRGVLDMKAGLAAALVAAASITPGELAGDLIVAAVADEEYASIGSERIVTNWRADGAIVLEPTNLTIVAEHRGFAVIEAVFHGRAAHTSRPERGANAIHAAARATVALADLAAGWAAGPDDPARRPLALVSRVHSGNETFTVPARCELIAELRTTADDPAGQIAAAVAAIEGSCGDTEVSTHVALVREPLGTGVDHPLTSALAAAAGAVRGSPPQIAAAGYWTDAALHARAGTPAVVFGPIGEGLHEDLEWVDTASIRTCAETLVALARTWCGHS